MTSSTAHATTVITWHAVHRGLQERSATWSVVSQAAHRARIVSNIFFLSLISFSYLWASVLGEYWTDSDTLDQIMTSVKLLPNMQTFWPAKTFFTALTGVAFFLIPINLTSESKLIFKTATLSTLHKPCRRGSSAEAVLRQCLQDVFRHTYTVLVTWFLPHNLTITVFIKQVKHELLHSLWRLSLPSESSELKNWKKKVIIVNHSNGMDFCLMPPLKLSLLTRAPCTWTDLCLHVLVPVPPCMTPP